VNTEILKQETKNRQKANVLKRKGRNIKNFEDGVTLTYCGNKARFEGTGRDDPAGQKLLREKQKSKCERGSLRWWEKVSSENKRGRKLQDKGEGREQ